MARSPFTLPATVHREVTNTGHVLPSQRMLVLSFCLILVGLMGGALISLRWQDRGTTGSAVASRQGDTALVAATIKRLEQEQADLRAQIGELRDKTSSMQAAQANNKSALAEVTDEITRQRIAAGLVQLNGAGISVRIDDSGDSVLPNEDPANYILHDFDLRDMVNTLWSAGAEAISINGERIIATSSIYCVGTTIVTNVTRLSPPYNLTAIGNADTLEAALRNSQQVASFRDRSLIYDLPFEISKTASATVPAYTGSIGFRYAEVGDEKSGEPTLTPGK